MSDEADRYAEAIEAFDAANLAWGRYRLETLPRYPVAALPVLDDLQQAMGDAAIAAAELLDEGDADSLRAALPVALRLLDGYRAALPDAVPGDDLAVAHDLLTEAATYLSPPRTSEGPPA